MTDDAHAEWCPEPEDLLQYFDWLTSENGRPQFVRGAEMTREWITLLDCDTVSQQQFDDFLSRLEDIDRPGSGYFDLWIRVRHWGYRLGLAVPDDHPWRIDMDVIQCIANAKFESQLTIGNDYRIVTLDESKQMVRLSNDQGKLRWYPYKNFKFPQRPDRNIVRMETDA